MRSRLLVRLLLPLVALSATLLLVAVGGAWYVHRLQANTSRALAGHIGAVRGAGELESALRDIRARLDRFLIKGDRAHLESIPGLRARAEVTLRQMAKECPTGEQVEVSRIAAGCAQFFGEYDALTSATPAEGLFWQVNGLLDRLLIEDVLRPTRAYLKRNEAGLSDAGRANAELSEWLVAALLGLGLSGSAAGLAAGAAMAVGVRRRLALLSTRLREAARRLGPAAGPISLGSGGDLGDLESAVTRLDAPIGDVVSRLHRVQRDARRAEQLAAVGQMAAGLAHEVRNPLMSIKILVQAGAESGDGLSGRDLRVLDEEVTRLERLIRTFLDFARPPQPVKRLFEVGSIVDQVFDVLGPSAALRGVELLCDAPPDPVEVEGDRGQLHQLLFNLVQNAIDATPTGGLVALHIDPPRDGTVSWRVLDTGGGLPAGLGNQIFEPFVSGKETGLGLGLSICRAIVDQHRGTLEAWSRPEGGAVFEVQLPAFADAPPVPA